MLFQQNENDMATTSPSLLHRLHYATNSSIAWNRFVELYTPLLMHWVKRLGLDTNEAADIVQEVMLTLMVRLPAFQYDPDQSFRSWLRTVALNQTRDYLRKKHTRKKYEDQAYRESEKFGDSLFSDQEFHQALAHRALELMKNEFEEMTWRACWESVVEGRKAVEIAEELGMTANAVYLAKGRVLRRLRSELDGMI